MRHFKAKTVSYFIFVMLIFSFSRVAVAAETAPPKGTSSVESLPIEDNQVKIGLKSVLMLGLKNNLDIAFLSYTPQIAATNVTRAESAYDTRFTTDFTKNRSRQQVGNVLMGSSNPVVTQERYNWNASVQKRFTPGTSAELKLNNENYNTDLTSQGLVPQYKSELILSLTQPLLRDFGIEIGTSQIRIANLNQQMSAEQFKKSVMDILYRIELFYWNLYFQNEDLKSKQISLKLAEDLLREMKIKIDAGTMAPIEIYQAEQNVAVRKEEIIVSKRRVRDAEDFLKSALNLYEKEKYWNVSIIPQDKPNLTEVHPALDECIRIALEKRPDFIKSKLDLKASNIQVKYAKNQTLPRIDLIGSIGTSGLAGRPQSTQGIYGPFVSTKPGPWTGHWDDVYDHMGSGDYYSYLIGLKLEIPLENRMAKSQYAQAKLQTAQSVTDLKRIEITIINEVRDAVREVETDVQRLETARAILKTSEETLAAEKKKYDVGMSTQRDVLDFQDRLQKAMSNLALVESDYSRAVSNLARVKGVLLDEKELSLTSTSN
ncbi:MAG: TolC family protein [Proteobacteria bacterium]|nr:TolC family protein [Pseudomonadota bacterium]